MPHTSTSSKDLFSLLLKGTSVNLVAKAVAVMLGFAASLLISRKYGADTLGTIATITSFYTLAATFSLLGTDTVVLKLIPQIATSHGIKNTQRYYNKLLALILASCCIVVTILVNVNALEIVKITNIHRYFPYALILAAAGLTFNSATLRALGDYVLFSLLDFLPPFLMLAIVLVSLFFSITEDVFTHIYFLGATLVCLISFVLLRIQFRDQNTESTTKNKVEFPIPRLLDTIKFSSPMLGVTLSTMIIQHTDILLIGHFKDQGTTGIYSVYIKLSGMVMFATISINAMFSPTVSLLYKEGKFRELESYAKKTTALLSLSAAIIALLLIAFSDFILGLYGMEYLPDKTCFYILLLAPVLHSCFGSTGFFLNMTGGQNVFFLIMAAAAILNLTGNLLLIPEFGIHGAAASSLAAVLTWNTAAMLVIKKRHGHTLFFTGNSK